VNPKASLDVVLQKEIPASTMNCNTGHPACSLVTILIYLKDNKISGFGTVVAMFLKDRPLNAVQSLQHCMHGQVIVFSSFVLKYYVIINDIC
jgi:hypothetical protein